MSLIIEAMPNVGKCAVGHKLLVVRDAKRDGRAVPVDLWYPAEVQAAGRRKSFYPLLKTPFMDLGLKSSLAGEDAPCDRTRRVPAIVLSHGHMGWSVESVRLTETLASHGFAVVAPTHIGSCADDVRKGTLNDETTACRDRIADIECLIRIITDSHSLDESGAWPGISVSSIGLIGESLGASSVLSYAGACRRSHVPSPAAILLIAPYTSYVSESDLAAVAAPTLIVGGTLDKAAPIDAHAIPLFRMLRSDPVYLLIVRGATHCHFMNVKDVGDTLRRVGIGRWTWSLLGIKPLRAVYEACTDSRTTPVGEVHKILCAYAAVFFCLHLCGDNTMEHAFLSGFDGQFGQIVDFQCRRGDRART